jgi:hypothetical protein
MTIEQAENKIKQAGGSVEVFWDWMRGQTMGINEDGSTNVYDYDVDRFIRYKCNPKNEPVWEID